MIRDTAGGESKVDWAQFLFSLEGADDMRILAASKDKIANEILRLRGQAQKQQKKAPPPSISSNNSLRIAYLQ